MRLLSGGGGGGRPSGAFSDWIPMTGMIGYPRADECTMMCDDGTTVVASIAMATAVVVTLAHLRSAWEALRRSDDEGKGDRYAVWRECLALLIAVGCGVTLFLRDVRRCRTQSAVCKLAVALVAANVILPWLWS